MNQIKRNKNDERRIQRYHCIKLLEGIVANDLDMADRHFTKLINKKLSAKIAKALQTQTLI